MELAVCQLCAQRTDPLEKQVPCVRRQNFGIPQQVGEMLSNTVAFARGLKGDAVDRGSNPRPCRLVTVPEWELDV